MQLFETTGQKFLHYPGTKGQAKNIAKDGTVRDSQDPGRDGPGQPNSRTGDKPGQSRKICSKTGKDVLNQENDISGERKLFRDRETFFVPGQRDSGTRKLFLSWEKGTARQGNFLSPDKGTTGRLLETYL